MDWLVALCGITSAYLLGEKHRAGWLVKAAGGLVALPINLHFGLYGFAAMSVMAAAVCLYNWWKWGQA